MKKIIDISVDMDGFCFPNNPQLDLRGPFSRVQGRNREYVYDFTLCTQSGTHIQGPHYFREKGRRIDDFGLDQFLAEAYIIDCPKRGEDTTRDDLEALLDGIDLRDKALVLYTGHMKELLASGRLINEERPGLSMDAAETHDNT